jgi:hypothetical protein
VGLGDHVLDLRQQLGRVRPADVRRFGRHDRVDAVGLPVHVLVDPGQLDLQLVGAEADRPQHPEPASAAHRRDDVPAVAEGEDRVLDPQLVADRRAHVLPPRVA